MPQFADPWGNTWTASNQGAVDAFARSITSYLGMRKDTGDHLKAAFDADPEMPIASIQKGYYGRFFATTSMEAMAQKAATKARLLLEEGEGTAQEYNHLLALETWAKGDMPGAVSIWEQILLDHPRDVMAIKLVQYNQFYQGDGPAMRASLSRVLYAWGDKTPAYGYMLGSYAFALEESDLYQLAEAAGRDAVERNPADIWAAHAVAHVCEMTGRPRDGEAFLTSCEANWADCHNFRHHAQWHRALFMLEDARYEEVLAFYDEKVWTEDAEDYLDIANGVSLLWRLEERGVGVGDRWEPLAALSETRNAEHLLAFADLHFLKALLRGGRDDAAQAMRLSMQRASEQGDTQALVLQKVGLAVADALLASAQGRPDEAVAVLWPRWGELYRLGGSKAQRDVFERFLIRAAIDAGSLQEAQAALSQKREARPKDAWTLQRWAELSR